AEVGDVYRLDEIGAGAGPQGGEAGRKVTQRGDEDRRDFPPQFGPDLPYDVRPSRRPAGMDQVHDNDVRGTAADRVAEMFQLPERNHLETEAADLGGKIQPLERTLLKEKDELALLLLKGFGRSHNLQGLQIHYRRLIDLGDLALHP